MEIRFRSEIGWNRGIEKFWVLDGVQAAVDLIKQRLANAAACKQAETYSFCRERVNRLIEVDSALRSGIGIIRLRPVFARKRAPTIREMSDSVNRVRDYLPQALVCEKGSQRQLSASRGAIFRRTLQGQIEPDGYQKMSPPILSGSHAARTFRISSTWFAIRDKWPSPGQKEAWLFGRVAAR